MTSSSHETVHLPQHVTCYACGKHVHVTDPGNRCWCQHCGAALNPAPKRVVEAGWPRRDVAGTARRPGAKFHARHPVKTIRFHEPIDRLLARRIEAVAQLEQKSINDVLLELLHSGWNHRGGPT